MSWTTDREGTSDMGQPRSYPGGGEGGGTREERGQPRATDLAGLRAKDSGSARCKLTNTQQYLRKSNWVRLGFPDGSEVKNPPANAGDAGDPWVGKIPQRRRVTHSSILAWKKSHGQRNLIVYNPQGSKSQPRLSD